MIGFRPSVEDIRRAFDLAGWQALAEAGLAGDADEALLGSLLSEAGRFAQDVLSPLNRPGDEVGAHRNGDAVSLPPGFVDAYRQWIEAGWNAVDQPGAYGGMDLPVVVGAAVMELWTSACMSFGLCPVLSQGGAELLYAHGSDDLKTTYLAKLVSGQWTGTMNITEAQAGSDLSQIRTRAEPEGDGTYRLFGEKIFITYGEHDLAENIVHLVLARTTDAPAGTRGLSLFLAPKFIPSATGALDERNALACIGIEHKLGVHASPTCTMRFGNDNGVGATAWLIGPLHGGLAGMFTMMNRARLATGMQGVAIADRASQAAWAYARERRQGKGHTGESVAIIEHPDVRRMLLDMRSATCAARALAYYAAISIDRAHRDRSAENATGTADALRDRAALLTPVVKAWCSEIGLEVASTAIQVHGGWGYIEETGAAQYYRDARIPPIYEGTNGIQAIDLMMRKTLRDRGAALVAVLDELDAAIAAAPERLLPATVEYWAAAHAAVRGCLQWIVDDARTDAERLAGAMHFLRLVGTTIAGGLLLRGEIAPERDSSTLVNVFAATRLGQVPHLSRLVTESASIADIPADQTGTAGS